MCCVSDAAVTYARDSFLLILRRAFCPLEGGGADILAPGLQIKEIAILLLFLLLAYYLCIHSIKCFFQQMTPASHEEMTVPTRRDYYP